MRVHNLKYNLQMIFKVYCCGSNGKYQLGTGTSEDLDSPEFVFESEYEILKIVCGGNHSLILLSNGDLYSVGDNTNGQCGFERLGIVEEFRKIEGKWKDCSAGYEFSILINYNNDIFSCGFGSKGELGLGKITRSFLTKLDLVVEEEIISVKSCLDHTVLLVSNGDLYVWGNGRNGKLIEIENKIYEPKLIKLEFKPSKIEVGRDFTIISDSDDPNNIKIFGKDRYGIGLNFPTEFKDYKTMWSSIHFLLDDKILSIGNNSHGQLIQDQPIFEEFEVGSEHGLLLSLNKVYSWGWGEHGNCGKKVNDSTTFPISLLFESNEKIVKIQGGCATSWIVTSI